MKVPKYNMIRFDDSDSGKQAADLVYRRINYFKFASRVLHIAGYSHKKTRKLNKYAAELGLELNRGMRDGRIGAGRGGSR